MPTFAIGETDFLLDGAPFQVISGAMHYFRIHPGLWEDRLRTARQMGLNTIETYVPWNAHEPVRGEFSAEGDLDLGRFLDLVQAQGMHAIVRPGPYICAEWHNGGLPEWLIADPGIRVRSQDPRYLAEVERYLTRVYDIVRPRQIHRGGGVILVQIENEYGAYGSDKAYLRALTNLTRDAGIEVPLTTVDQPAGSMLDDGTLPDLHSTASFGSRAAERLAALRRHQQTGPLMCSEFWCGWFDSWGEPHHTTSAADSAAELETLLAAGASVNIYMVHGGTNFGYTAGANDKGVYRPIATSYDYDAPIAEDGTPTEKYWRFRDVIAAYAPVPEDLPAPRTPARVLEAPLVRAVALADAGLESWTRHETAPAATAFGSPRGYSRYAVAVPHGGALTVGEARDRAHVFLDGRPVGILDREAHDRVLTVPAAGELSILVEHLGGVNYGPRIGEAKGLIGPVRLDGEELHDWAVSPLELTADAVRAALAAHGTAVRPGVPVAGPVLLGGVFDADPSGDLHLDVSGWGSGAVWINGFALGRHSARGPQETLYVPAPVLRAGGNEILVLELRGAERPTVRFAEWPRLGPTEF
ncbi:glycoside hydrolase family 35 protein [Microbacterium azadirachtae]|uniref:glycoside hydrolase family 35 protein n=1 Tax=Microbacterium azadirachtae TaxID=582680 RepID=UPI00088DD7EA|nr:beta-galactosidase family protein [Microbacterium azadirachtae]SDL58136.1 beta-galactosidase [Microbacterium azadirachtae]SEF87035.1 beta-galactosidase [Microbacterium azadirachtae]SEF88837.1 beta-galactosidase [Microbacterium azadirachtae]